MFEGLPKYSGKKKLIARDHTTDDIIKEVSDAHNFFAKDYDHLTDYFDNPDPKTVAKKLFKFCKKNIAYKIERESIQTTRSPAGILKMGNGDCKHYAGFIGGVISAINRKEKAGIGWAYRFASYDPNDDTPTHVFIVVNVGGEEYWVDPVLDQFDQRTPKPAFYTDEKIDDMALIRLSGAPRRRKRVGDVFTDLAALQTSINTGAGSKAATTAQTIVTAAGNAANSGGGVVNTVNALAPALSLIPVVGPFLSIGAGLVKTFAGIFGGGYSTSTGVRWLTYLYQREVLGQDIQYKGVNEALTNDCHTWFQAVLGVPVYDHFRWHTLAGTSPVNGAALVPMPSVDARAAAYMQYPDVQAAGVTLADAKIAATIAGNMANPEGRIGVWKGQQLAPSYAAKLRAAQGVNASIIPKMSNSTLLLIGGAGIIYFLMLKKKR